MRFGRSGQRIVARHEGDARLGMAPLGDVLIGRDPAAVGHRLMDDRDDAAVAELLVIGAARRWLTNSACSAIRSGALLPDWAPAAMLSSRTSRKVSPGRTRSGGRSENLAEAPVDDLQAVVGVVQAEALRHIVERGVETQVGRRELLLLLLQVG